MKNFRRIIALILALLALPMCFIACDKTSGGDVTEDPNDTTDGIRVIITISGLEEKDGTRTPLLKTRDAEVFRVAPGTKLEDAVAALCASRENASYTLENTGRFASFTYGSDKLEATVEEKGADGENKIFVEVYFKVTVNGTELKPEEAPAYVLNHNDKVEIFLVKGEEFTAKQ